ncbi:MAG: cytosolic protein [Acidobacteria bacterium]|nr:cytosolic protein [Acidobacteriota bacterium]
MSSSKYEQYFHYLGENVVIPFYEKRLEKLKKLSLKDILQRKNPYLFKAKNIMTAAEFVESILMAYLSSQEETIFGDLLEKFALYVSYIEYQGKKSNFKSVDLEFEKENVYYIVGIKSGPNWGNSDQIAQMRTNFKLAKEKLKNNGVNKEIIAINGCIYGKDNHPFKTHIELEKAYYKYCGQDFWEFISGDNNLYREIITPIDKEAKKKDEVFKIAYVGKFNEMTQEFMRHFIIDNQIDWVKLIDFVSQRKSS